MTVALSSAVDLLRCPVCSESLTAQEQRLLCARGHSFDIAKQGYVALLTGRSTPMVGDTVAMVDARQRFLAAGHYEPIAAALAELVVEYAGTPVRVLDIGAGTGYYLNRVLDAAPDGIGVGLDVSKPAARRLARAHPRAAAVVADAWQGLPVRDGAVSVVLSVFAPRNAAEIARVLAPGAMFVVVTPTARHLGELIEPLEMVRVDEHKERRLDESLAGRFEQIGRRAVEFPMTLRRNEVATLVGMGPSAHHGDPSRRSGLIESLGETSQVTASVLVTRYRAVDQPCLATTSE
ncbi:methyltransferase domain-containing protein [Aldersonia sp. NBC_00410]|uniref:putative RNA methyltransferase n=1 Tax=Aldersonia sp. NBC_00410 TaxID=2975954 RepID=UPI0022507D77|nr:methyltransferase domain-containing protein [Aldersonia sp. NBC_00410]MCX5043762.1 methyltransferase domain-containing protein [Aldersonia sp. NBC_00410]